MAQRLSDAQGFRLVAITNEACVELSLHVLGNHGRSALCTICICFGFRQQGAVRGDQCVEITLPALTRSGTATLALRATVSSAIIAFGLIFAAKQRLDALFQSDFVAQQKFLTFLHLLHIDVQARYIFGSQNTDRGDKRALVDLYGTKRKPIITVRIPPNICEPFLRPIRSSSARRHPSRQPRAYSSWEDGPPA